jgi:TRAP-type transport system periplasmic protein
MRQGWIGGGVAATVLAVMAQGAVADELPQTVIQFVGNSSNSYIWFEAERDFIEKTVPEASGGRVTIEGIAIDQAGLSGPEILGLLEDGVLQFASYNLSYMAGDDPRFEGPDLAGLTLNYEDGRKAVEAYRPVIAENMAERFNVKLLALAQSPAQVFWCRVPIEGIEDLEGKRIRVYNPTLADFVNGIGGTTVTIPFAEAIPAMQRGVADCAITGTLNGNTAGFPEVTSHLYPLYTGWAVLFWAVNMDAWNALDPAVQDFLEQQFADLEDRIWALGEEVDEDGISCSTGGPCNRGIPANMTLVPVKESDLERHAQVVREHVVPNWARRCGAECAAEWNETVGAALGITGPTDF